MNHIEHSPIAVIGMACRLPQADGLDAFWQVLHEGRCTAVELPPERLNRKLHYDPRKGVRCKSYTTIACLVDYQPIDPQRVPLTAEEIANSDISHTTMAHVAAESCRHAGFDPFNMPPELRHCGVYIGHVKGSELGGHITYSNLIEQTAQWLREVPGIDQLTGGQTDAIVNEIIEKVRRESPSRDEQGNPNLNGSQCAALIAKALKLDGPLAVINSACASSLQAIAMAVRALQLGYIDMAIAGGASYCKFDSLVMFSQAQSCSATGTRPFDADADGLVNGEGYVSLILKTLDRALTDKDKIYAVIRGIGISSDGRGKSLWAPKMEGQVEAIGRAYSNSGLDVSRLQYIECHATSTQVGDQTEIESLAVTLKDKLPPGAKIPIGSVKGNVGHTIESAGVSGVLKTILAMQHGIIPPAVNVKKLNPEIDWANAPFTVPLAPTAWPKPADGHPRRAAVNSFGIGGLNVHIVMDDGPLPAELLNFQQHGSIRGAQGKLPAPRPEPIAIVGIGGMFPGALDQEKFAELILSGRDPKVDLPATRWNAEYTHDADSASKHGPAKIFRTPSIHGGFITDFEYDWKTHKIPPKQVASADPLQFMLLESVDQAMKSYGYANKNFDRKRVGAYVGGITSGEFHEHLQMGLRLPEFHEELTAALQQRGIAAEQIAKACDGYTAALLRHMPAITDETGSYTSNTLVSRITKAYDLMGGGAAIDAGGASGAVSLSTCVDLLQMGDTDMMICTAGQRSMGFSAFQYYALKGVLVHGPVPSPFDTRSHGLVPGEGVGVLILKRLSDAQRDGDKIFGVIRGIGASRSDNFEEAMKRAIERGLERSGVSPDDVSYVEAAAFGLTQLDKQEISALTACYKLAGRDEQLTLGTLHNQIGYTGAAATLASLLKTVHALDRIESPANVHLDKPAGFVSSLQATAPEKILIPAKTAAMPVATADGRLIAAVNSQCADQLAYHIVVERGEPVPAAQRAPKRKKPTTLARRASEGASPITSPAPAVPLPLIATTPTTSLPSLARRASEADHFGNFRIVRLSADSPATLADKLKGLAATAADSYATAANSVFAPADPFRLTIVAEKAEEVAQKATFAAPLLVKPESKIALEEKGIFFHHVGPGPRQPKIAFLFPGHGSQYAGMLQSLVTEFAPAADALVRINAILKNLGFDLFETVAWERGETLGKDVWQTQLALLCADTIMLCALRTIGVQADRVSGHSFGEFPALIAAGAWTFEAAVRATHARCSCIEACPKARGIMMSVGASVEQLDSHRAEFNGQITVSVRNAPDQIVVGGDEASVLKLGERLSKHNIFTRVLPAPRPFHTPLMSDVKPPFAEAISGIEMQPPIVPMLSSVTNRYVADVAAIRNNLVEQMTDPVDYDDLIRRLADEGVNVFVEVGPQQSLTKLHRRILEGRDVVLVGSDQPKRSGLRQLMNVRASLEACGALDPREDDVSRILGSSRSTSVPAYAIP